MKRKRNSLSAVCKIAGLIGRIEPLYFLWTVPQIVVGAAVKILYVYAPKLIIDRLCDASPYRTVAATVLAYAACLLVLNVFLKLAQGKSAFHAGEFARKLRYDVGQTVMALPLSDIEGKTHREIINLAGQATSLTDTMSTAEGILSSSITVLLLGAIIVRLDTVLLLSVLAVLSVKILLTGLRIRYDRKEQPIRNENQLVGAYLSELAYWTPGAEKEIRISELDQWFLTKVKGYRRDMLVWQYRDFRRYALFECLVAISVAVQSLVVLLILSDRYLGGSLTVADFTMYFGAVLTLGTTLSAFTEQIGTVQKQVWNFSHLERLFDLRKEGAAVTGGAISANETDSDPDIVFDNVSFSYGEGAPSVLDRVDLTVKSGEKLVIVGMNGAGKTTLIKLLCRFYRPTAGRILIGGRDISSIPNDEYHRLIAAVFQDHSEFAFTVAENMALSEDIDRSKVHSILRELGLDTWVGQMPNGADTYLSRSFSEAGVDPSGGEMQKLAIAKAMYKDPPILILDEPTASLDPMAESEIYERFFRMTSGLGAGLDAGFEDGLQVRHPAKKTMVFISHRLAASTMADRIVVLDHGRIVEAGAHAELMEADGLYAAMFRKQSEPYIDRAE